MDKNYWELGSWRRVPVAMHWTVLVSAAWLYLLFMDLLATAIGSVALLGVYLAHEAGHVLLLRRRRIPIERIELFGLHGRTLYDHAPHPQEILIAWGGVAAQMLVLLVGVALLFAVPVLPVVIGPISYVFINVNIFLMILALLPIGPFDGRVAWQVIPLARKAYRQRQKRARERKAFPETALSPEKRRELEESSSKAAAELLQKLAKPPADRQGRE